MSETGRGKVVVIGDRDTLPLFRAAGARVVEAYSDSEVIEALRSVAGEAGIAIVLKHVVEDEEAVRREAEKLGIHVFILATRWAPAEAVSIEKLIARALGIG